MSATTVTPSTTPSVTPARPRRWSLLRALLRQPVAALSILFLMLIILASLLAPLIAPYPPDALDLPNRLSGPSANHLLGSDDLGRDVLSRLLFGGLKALFGILEAVLVAALVAIPIGILAGYLGGLFDRIITWLTDMILAIPAIILVLVVLTLFPKNSHAAMITFGLLVAPGFARVIRSGTLPLREADFVAAARVAGVSEGRIMSRHILPGVTRLAIVQSSLIAANSLLFVVALGFLGLTANPGEAEWGQMVAVASQQINNHPWLLVPTGGLIALMVLALILIGNALRDATAETSITRDPNSLSGTPNTPADRSVDLQDSAYPTVEKAHAQALELTRAPAPEALLSVRDFSVAFSNRSGDLLVVDRVNFDVGHGETVGLVGESGAGKSITALAILRLLPRGGRVVGGQVFFEGNDISHLDDRQYEHLLGNGLGLVSQEPLSSLDPTFTVGSQLGELVQLHDKVKGKKAQERCVELLRQVQLRQPERVLKSYPHELSGGMAQRVAIAMALAGRPKLLIADEPTTALDVTIQKEILDLLRQLQLEMNMSVLIVTHNMGVVADICDRVIVLYAGQVFEEAGIFPLFDQPLNPYTKGLLNANPALARPGQLLKVIPGRVPAPGSWSKGCRFAPRCEFFAPKCSESPVPLFEVSRGRYSRCIRIDEVFGDSGNGTLNGENN